MTEKTTFYRLFIDELRDIYNAENQLVKALPKLVKASSNKDLKAAFANHLEETKNQVVRLEKIFNKLNEKPEGETCEAMQGLIEEADEFSKKFDASATRDAAIIAAAQRVEHYEIAVYGTLRTFADELGHEDLAELLQETLDEEGNANKKLTSIAEGGVFKTGVNEEALKR